MSASVIAVDFDLLEQHKRRLYVIAEDIHRARQAADSVNLSGGAFGLLCTPLLVPGVSVVEAAAKNAIGDAARLVEETAVATGGLACDYREIEYAALDTIRGLDAELGTDHASIYGLRGARTSTGSGGSRGAGFGSNPLVAGPVDLTTPLSGTFLLEDGQALADAIKNQDWLSGGMAAFATAVDTVAMLSDPVGQLFAMGFGWILDHVEPLKGWLNDLTGDGGEVAGFAQTWRNIETQLVESGSELERVTASNLGEMHGAGIDAAIAFHRDLANHLDAAGTWAGAMGTGLEIGSTIVQIVHDITRDAIAEVAGAICSYVLEAVFTLGAALPLIIEQASTKALAIATRIGRHIDKLKTLRKLLDDLGKMFDNLATTFRSALSEGGTARKALANDQGSIPAGALIPGIGSNSTPANPVVTTRGDIPSPGHTKTDGGDGVVTFKTPDGLTEIEKAQFRDYVDGANNATVNGGLAGDGRVPTKGGLRGDASDAAGAERTRATGAGTPYQGQVGHVPDTTWSGQPEPSAWWSDQTPRVNGSLGGQTNRYPFGFKPSGFEVEFPDGTIYPTRPTPLKPPGSNTQ